MIALNFGEIGFHPGRVSDIKSFINKYNWKRINYLSKMDDWKTFGKNNPTIALNILYLKKKKYVQLIYQKLIRIVKKNYANDSKWRRERMALSCSKEIVGIIKWNNFKS